jgi:hypothetical protein
VTSYPRTERRPHEKAFNGVQRRRQRRRTRSNTVLAIPERASATAASLRGTLRVNNRRGGGGVRARNTGWLEGNLSITITQNKRNGHDEPDDLYSAEPDNDDIPSSSLL